MGLKVRITNLNTSYRINERAFRRISSHVFKHFPRIDPASLEIVFLTNAQIKILNKKYKGEPRPTDVLSFDLSEALYGSEGLLGSIFISIDKALENSKIFNTSFAEELTLYVIHGILHLAGYDDEYPAERARMEKRQKRILGYICKRENLSKVLTPR